MNFSAWAIRNPIAPILAFVMLMVLGWQSFNSLPITRFPNIDVPLVGITVVQPGAAPAEMESQVTKELEDAVAGVNGVKNVTSTVNDGISTTVVEFRMEVPTDKAVQDVKDAIDKIRGDLPGDVDAPIVSRIDVEGQAIMTFAVSAPKLTRPGRRPLPDFRQGRAAFDLARLTCQHPPQLLTASPMRP